MPELALGLCLLMLDHTSPSQAACSGISWVSQPMVPQYVGASELLPVDPMALQFITEHTSRSRDGVQSTV